MSKVELKVGDIFNFTKVCYLYYKILELDKSSNYAKIELICPYDVDNWDENWTISSIEEGFEDVTFQKIADRCGITRTTLYIYFKNKREIFLWSIKQLTSRLEAELVSIVKNKSVSAETALRSMLEKIIDECQENQKLFSVLLPYLLQLQKAGIDSGERVRRRVIRLRHLLSLLVIQGIKNGEFNNINVKDTNELLYSFIESAIFRLVILNQNNIQEMKAAINLAIDGITRK